MKRRFTAILLALCMALTLLPAQALAEGTEDVPAGADVEKAKSAAADFTVTAGEAATTDLEFQVPITVTAPIGSKCICGVEYRQHDGSQALSDSKWVDFSKEETRTFQLSLPAYPGKTYTYRAFVSDSNEEQKNYKSSEHTVTMPALGTEPEALTKDVWTTPAKDRSVYSFTPAANENYLFTAAGEYGILTILQEDGTWDQLYYFHEGEMTVNLPLQAGKRVYVIQEEDSWSETPGSVMVRTTPLCAVLNYEGNQVTVSMDAAAPGQYIFAAYDWDGKLLDARTTDKTSGSAETLTATLSAGRNAEYVKAFRLDASYKPQAASERTPIRVSSAGETDEIKNFFVFKESYQSLVNGKLVYCIDGWDIKGSEISLNIGTKNPGDRYKPGDLVEYTNVGAEDFAEWVLKDHAAGSEIYSVAAGDGYEIKASNSRISISDAREGAEDRPFIADDVKFIFVTFDNNGEVDSIEVKNGVQNVGNADLMEKGSSN